MCQYYQVMKTRRFNVQILECIVSKKKKMFQKKKKVKNKIEDTEANSWQL